MATKVATRGQTTVSGEVERPYKGVPIAEIADQIQHDYSDGRPHDDALVFELLNRALEAEGAVYSGEA